MQTHRCYVYYYSYCMNKLFVVQSQKLRIYVLTHLAPFCPCCPFFNVCLFVGAANTLFSHVITGQDLVSSTYFLVTVRRGNINYAHTHTYIHFDLTSQTHNFRKVKSKIRIVLSRTQDSKTAQSHRIYYTFQK